MSSKAAIKSLLPGHVPSKVPYQYQVPLLATLQNTADFAIGRKRTLVFQTTQFLVEASRQTMSNLAFNAAKLQILLRTYNHMVFQNGRERVMQPVHRKNHPPSKNQNLKPSVTATLIHHRAYL